jgi:hypothetical protein
MRLGVEKQEREREREERERRERGERREREREREEKGRFGRLVSFCAPVKKCLCDDNAFESSLESVRYQSGKGQFDIHTHCKSGSR